MIETVIHLVTFVSCPANCAITSKSVLLTTIFQACATIHARIITARSCI
uniref:Uncharacterized protein n=1 Tax=Parascaris equorum TaxID=6256 RepID=A0A914S459_PAREQ